MTPSSSHLSKGRLGDLSSWAIALLDCSEGGISDKAKRVASRTCALASSKRFALRIASIELVFKGRTFKAFNLTPAEAWVSAASATFVAGEFSSSSAPRPFKVQSA